jgi:3-phenylpropionate/cinnamic acid dioxygenase small subunit
MDLDAGKGRFSRSRRGFVRASAHTALGLMAAAMLPAEASSTTSRPARDTDAMNRGDNGMTLSLQEISDRLEIEELLVRYCYAVDDRDWNAYRNIFTSDAVLDDTVTGGIRSGVEEHVTYMQRALSKILISQHAISTILIEVRGDDANVRVHCSCPMVVDIGEGKRHVFFQGLWYRDRVVRTPNGWRISELVEEGYWNHNLPEGFRF